MKSFPVARSNTCTEGIETMFRALGQRRMGCESFLVDGVWVASRDIAISRIRVGQTGPDY